MRKWSGNNDIFMCLTYNEDTSVVAERFTKILKGKIHKKIKANHTKSYLSYLNKLVDEYNNTYHPSIGKKCSLMLIILL